MPLKSATTTIRAPRVFDGSSWLGPTDVTIADGVIVDVGTADHAAPSGAIVLPANTILAPGFIDLQVNGGGGVLFNDAPEAGTVETMLAAHRRFGTTGFLPTLISDAPEKLSRLAATIADIVALPGVLGVHLEGPFLNPARKGVHDERYLRTPTEADIAAIEAIGRQSRVLLTLAPECVPAGFIARLARQGIIVSIGHSDATEAQVRAAIDEGARGVTHLFNAMSQFTAREAGVVGTALDDRRLTAGLIVDGRHVSPTALRLAFTIAGRQRLALVTDAMPTLGSDKPVFALNGRTIRLVDGRLQTEDGTLAGAHLGMIEAVRNAVVLAGADLEDALVMASATPAALLHIDDLRGRIAAGRRADLTAFSTDFHSLQTWIAGRA